MVNKLTRFTFYNMYWNVIKNAEDEEIDSRTEKHECILSFEDFMKAHPHIVNDLYQSNKEAK